MNPQPNVKTALGYARISKAEADEDNLSLATQRAAIEAEAQRRGWALANVIEETASGRSMKRRLGLQAALAKLKVGEAQALICTKLDRLGRDVGDFAELLKQAEVENWAMVLLDIQIDTTTSSGEMFAHNVASFAQYERKRIGERTKEALHQRQAEGVQLGRPSDLPPATVAQIKNLSRTRSPYAVANYLNAKGVPTARGGRQWYPSTVRAILKRTA